MESKSNTTSSLRGANQPRNPAAHRRAYLDTYAKRSGRSSVEPEAAPVQNAVQQPAVVQSQVIAQNPVVVTPAQQVKVRVQEEYIQPQPPVATYTQKPTQAVIFNDIQAPVELTQRSYLDTLTRRHVQAVAQAPVAEETVIQPSINTETATLFEDPANDAKLAANLNSLYNGSLTDMIAKDSKNASVSHVRTIIATAFACGFMAVGIFTFMGRYDAQPVVAQPIGSPVIEVESSAQAPKEAPVVADTNGIVAADPEHPVRVVISSIGVNAPVDGLGTTPEGLIAVPKAYGVVGWYNKGSIPGKPGPAVLVGHYAGGNGAVFDKLGNLNNGDLITTTNGKGQSFTYRVTAKNEYNKDQVPMAQIFKSSPDSRLEIITCAGKWQAKTYNNRLVISAELVK